MSPTPIFDSLTKQQRERAFYSYSGLPDTVGGHSLEPTGAAASLYAMARERYPVNEVPPELVSRLKYLRSHAIEFEREACAILEFMAAEIVAEAPKW